MKIIPISLNEMDVISDTERIKIIDSGEFLKIFAFNTKQTVETATYIIKGNIININCPKCDSPRIVKHGMRKNLFSLKQRWRCKDCKQYFTPEGTKLKLPDSIRKFVKDNKELSSRKISKKIKEDFGIYVSHATVAMILNTEFPERIRLKGGFSKQNDKHNNNKRS